MSSRLRLTLAYVTLVCVATLLVGTVFWLTRRSNIYQELAPIAVERAELTMELLKQAEPYASSATVTTLDTVVRNGDTLVTERPILSPSLQRLIDSLPGYTVVLDSSGRSIYWSGQVRALSDQQWELLRDNLVSLPDGGPVGVLMLDEEVLFAASNFKAQNSAFSRVVVGVPAGSFLQFSGETIPVLILCAVLILVGSAIVAYTILGRPFKQLQRIIDDLSAISDGRSLHRRVAVEEDADPEIERQAGVLNAMIGRLEDSFRALRQFTADASHELKTPLAVLRADIERAMNASTSSKEKLVALEESLQEVTRMSNLVESLLTLARADEGRFDLHMEPVELGPLVQEVYETALILGEGAGVKVTMPFTTDVVVMGDQIRLRQLFLNLVTNAIKYNRPGGRVDIGLGQHPGNVTFAVRDTGIGIAAADLPHIFDRFWRVDRVRTRTSGGGAQDAHGDIADAARGGFGLGLSISRWIAQAHGGSLTVSSRLGQGSLFTVTLPLKDQPHTNA